MILRLRYVAFAGLAAAMAVPASAVVVIDDFTQGATSLAVVGTTGWQESQQTTTNIPGLQRDVLLRVTSNPFQRNASFDIVPGQGMSFYASGPGVVGFVGLDYDGVDVEGSDGVQTAGPGANMDFTGQTAIRFNFAFVDLGTVIHMDAYTYAGTKQSSVNFTVGSGITSATLVDVPISGFSSVTGGGVDWSHVDRLVIDFNSNNAATDFALSNISAVPEPASMAALAIGAFGLIAKRRRNRK